jgi:hypothetical protein
MLLLDRSSTLYFGLLNLDALDSVLSAQLTDRQRDTMRNQYGATIARLTIREPFQHETVLDSLEWTDNIAISDSCLDFNGNDAVMDIGKHYIRTVAGRERVFKANRPHAGFAKSGFRVVSYVALEPLMRDRLTTSRGLAAFSRDRVHLQIKATRVMELGDDIRVLLVRDLHQPGMQRSKPTKVPGGLVSEGLHQLRTGHEARS